MNIEYRTQDRNKINIAFKFRKLLRLVRQKRELSPNFSIRRLSIKRRIRSVFFPSTSVTPCIIKMKIYDRTSCERTYRILLLSSFCRGKTFSASARVSETSNTIMSVDMKYGLAIRFVSKLSISYVYFSTFPLIIDFPMWKYAFVIRNCSRNEIKGKTLWL